MELCVEVGAAILDDGKAKVGVGGFEQRGENYAAGGDSVVCVWAQRVDAGCWRGADAVYGSGRVGRGAGLSHGAFACAGAGYCAGA